MQNQFHGHRSFILLVEEGKEFTNLVSISSIQLMLGLTLFLAEQLEGQM